MWFARILVILGWTLIGFAGCHLPAIIVAMVYDSAASAQIFLTSAVISAFVGILTIVGLRGMGTANDRRLWLYVPIVLWCGLPLFAAIPFYLSGYYPDFGNAYFEAVSGLTTTGASVISNPSILPGEIAFWRAFLEWLGGLGVIVVAATIFTRLNIGCFRIVQTWLPAGEGEGVAAQLKGNLEALVPIYTLLTLTCWALLLLAGTGFLEGLNLALTTVSTGGFSGHEGGVAIRGNRLAEAVLLVFMFAGAVSITLHRKAFADWRPHYRGNAEFMSFVRFVPLVAVILFVIAVVGHETLESASIGEIVWDAVFVSISMASTTGFLPDGLQTEHMPAGLSQLALGIAAMGLVVLGGTTISTTGGIKMMRAILLFRHIRQELRRLAYPNIVAPIRHQDQEVSDDDMASVWTLVLTILLAIGLGSLFLAVSGLAFPVAMGTAIAASTNAGPAAFLMVADFQGYAEMAGGTKSLIVVLMVLGRVEGALLLAIFARSFWHNR